MQQSGMSLESAIPVQGVRAYDPRERNSGADSLHPQCLAMKMAR